LVALVALTGIVAPSSSAHAAPEEKRFAAALFENPLNEDPRPHLPALRKQVVAEATKKSKPQAREAGTPAQPLQQQGPTSARIQSGSRRHPRPRPLSMPHEHQAMTTGQRQIA
jgi:hypothetical protein